MKNLFFFRERFKDAVEVEELKKLGIIIIKDPFFSEIYITHANSLLMSEE